MARRRARRLRVIVSAGRVVLACHGCGCPVPMIAGWDRWQYPPCAACVSRPWPPPLHPRRRPTVAEVIAGIPASCPEPLPVARVVSGSRWRRWLAWWL